ncbi:hypothetical protein AB837_00201 [bacterium AB1]|nr:hypothetical protein AB837_00201 [bacterium AB1]
MSTLKLNSADSIIKINNLIVDLMTDKNMYYAINISKKVIDSSFEYMKTKLYDEIRILCCYPLCINILTEMKEENHQFDTAKDLIDHFNSCIEKLKKEI